MLIKIQQLTDGLCDSSCALFVEMMHFEAGVKTIVVGGRPGSGPMQATGGTRGARFYPIDTLEQDIWYAQRIANITQQVADIPERKNEIFTLSAGLNLLDAVRKHDPTPLQFIWEPADCRIYYSQDTIFNQTALWLYAAKAGWSNRSLCVVNSTGSPDPPESITIPLATDSQPDESLGAPLGQSLQQLGDDGSEASYHAQEFMYQVTGARCTPGQNACPYPEYFQCQYILGCDIRGLPSIYTCLPKCLYGDQCPISPKLAGDCYTRKFSNNYDVSGVCTPIPREMCKERFPSIPQIQVGQG